MTTATLICKIPLNLIVSHLVLAKYCSQHFQTCVVLKIFCKYGDNVIALQVTVCVWCVWCSSEGGWEGEREIAKKKKINK